MWTNYLSLFKVVPIWAAIMTGSLSLVREAVTLFAQSPDPIWQKNIFWSCVWIAFIVSAITAWVLKHQELLAEKAKNASPEITGEIEKVHAESFVDCFLTIKVRIANNRAATTISGFSLAVKFEGGIHEGQSATVNEYFIERREYHPIPFETQSETLYDPLKDLAKDNDVLLVQRAHRTGWLRFVFIFEALDSRFVTYDGKEQFLKEGVELVLTVKDAFGNPHLINYVSRGEPQHVVIRRIQEPPEWKELR
jgi:hypothetical protein